MTLTAMTKEQKQYLVLGTLVGGILLYSLVTFGLAPMKQNWSEARGEVDELRVKVDDGERLIRGKSKLTENFEASKATMLAAAASHMPDTANPLAWATRTLYAAARDVGLDIQSVSEVAAPQVLVKQGTAGDRFFGAYAVKVETSCGFEMLKQFLHALEGANPYVCVSAIRVESKSQQPEQHRTNLTIEWPAWTESSPQKEPSGLTGV